MAIYEYRTEVLTHGFLGRKDEEFDRKEFEERLNQVGRRGLGVRQADPEHGAARGEGRAPDRLQARVGVTTSRSSAGAFWRRESATNGSPASVIAALITYVVG